MSVTLFVGNLYYLTEKEELFAHFSKYGEIIRISIPIDKETGYNKGIAFVNYSNEQFALEAIKNLNGTEFRNRLIRVRLASPYKKSISEYNYNNSDSANSLNCTVGIIMFMAFIYIISRKSNS